jgi:tetratricopeptide (TPR) repeat protein
MHSGITVNWRPFIEAGFIAEKEGRIEDAELLYKRALRLAESDVGFEHEEVADTLIYLAGMYESERRFGEAEEALRRALEIVEHACGAFHPALAVLTRSLSDVCEAQGKLPEALQLRHRSRELVDRELMHIPREAA